MSNFLQVFEMMAAVALIVFSARSGWSLYDRFVRNWSSFFRELRKKKP